MGAIALATLALVSSSAQAHDANFKFRAWGTATINGTFSPGEWDGAGKWDFTANVLPSGTTPATLYVMNDGSSLYLGLRVTQPPVGVSGLVFEFDNDDDGNWPENGDDVLLLNSDPIRFYDEFRTNQPPCQPNVFCGFVDEDGGGIADGRGAVTNDGSVTTYELSHPLDTADDAHDFSLRLGKRVGFWMELRFCGPGTCVDTYSPRNGDITLTSASPVPPDTSITEGPAEGSFVTDPAVTLKFGGSDEVIAPEDLTFECRLGQSPFEPCTSPVPYFLEEGQQTFAVRAIDEVGNIDPTPAIRTWTLDTEAPSKPIVQGPRRLKRSRAAYTLTSQDSLDSVAQLGYRCSVDRRLLKPCSRKLVVRLSFGRHVLRARAVDRAGHLSALATVKVVRVKP